MICGGAEGAVCRLGIAGFAAARALTTKYNDNPTEASRPWDKNRDGFVIGEGAAVLILEELEHAKKRGAPILAEYFGGAVSADAHHMTSPREDGSGVAEAMEKAIEDAGIAKTDINYINAHATSTVVGDLCEIRAIRSVFGDHVKNIKMNATKSMTGHCLGSAAGVEAIATIKAIQTSKLHPTINLDDPEEELEGIDVVPDKAQDFEVNVAMSNSFGFGGHNSAVLFAPYQP